LPGNNLFELPEKKFQVDFESKGNEWLRGRGKFKVYFIKKRIISIDKDNNNGLY